MTIPAVEAQFIYPYKQEYRNIEEVPEKVFIHLFKIVHQISKALIKTFQLQG